MCGAFVCKVYVVKFLLGDMKIFSLCNFKERSKITIAAIIYFLGEKKEADSDSGSIFTYSIIVL